MWGCEEGLPAGIFHVVIATLAPEPAALVPWIWNLGLTGAEIWIYHRLAPSDPRLAAAATTLDTFRPYPCHSTLRLQPLLPNKGREAAVYLSHIVRHYAALPEGLVLIHDHGPAARHSLCGPFFRRLRGYYIGIREQKRGNSNSSSYGDGDGVSSSGGGADGEAGGGSTGAASAEEGPREEGRNLAAAGAAAVAGGGAAGGGYRSRRSAAKAAATRRLLVRFADMAVSLSSGCQENWLQGCCARLVCSGDGEHPFSLPRLDSLPAAAVGAATTTPRSTDPHAAALAAEAAVVDAGGAAGSLSSASAQQQQRQQQQRGDPGRRRLRLMAAGRAPTGRCPFRTPKCLAEPPGGSETHHRGPASSSSSRRLYLHGAGGLYESRYENMVVMYGMAAEDAAAAVAGGDGGVANGGFGPLSLVRYAGADALEMVRDQTSSSRDLDYPDGAAQRSKQQTFAELGAILRTFNFSSRRATSGSFKSCCASLMLRPKHIRQWPLELYEQILSYALDGRNTYHASLAVSHHGWSMWADSEVGPDDLLRYFEVDLALLRIRGCPGWRMVEAGGAAAAAEEA